MNIKGKNLLIILGVVVVLAVILFVVFGSSGTQSDGGNTGVNNEGLSDNSETIDPDFYSTITNEQYEAMSEAERAEYNEKIQEEERKWEHGEYTEEPDAKYSSGDAYSLLFGDGQLLVKTVDSTSDGLSLDISFLPATESHYGIYILAERIDVTYSDTFGLPYDGEDYEGLTSFFILDRTYDMVIPSGVVTWENDPLEDDLEYTGDTLYLRIVNLDFNRMVGVARASIECVDNTYYLSALSEGDVEYTGELTAEERSEIVDAAYEEAKAIYVSITGKVFGLTLDECRESAIVDHVPYTYFGKVMDMSGQKIPSGKYSQCEKYAVTISFPTFGMITIYFAPEIQVIGLSITPSDGELDLTPFAYDIINPRTQESLVQKPTD